MPSTKELPTELGQPLPLAGKKQVQVQLNRIVGWSDTERAPISTGQPFVRGNEAQIGDHPYFVCERSVGVRTLAILAQGRCYLVYPSYDIREVPLFCPVRPDRLQPGADRNVAVQHHWTIVDGLLVCDKEGSKSVVTFLLYDILALNGSPVMASKLQDRLKLIQNDVIGPRKQISLPKNHPPEPFQLVLQSMYPLNRLGHVIRSILPRVSQTRQNLGLVFTPVLLPYTPGQAKALYYWTPGAKQTAEFQLSVEWRGRPPMPGFKLMLHDKRTQVFHDWVTFPSEVFESLRQDKKSSSRIIECMYDAEWLTFIPSNDKSSWDVGNPEFNATDRGLGWRKGGWRYVRTRPDMAMPMEKSSLALIERAVSEDMRLDEVENLLSDDPNRKANAAASQKRSEPASPAQDYGHVSKKKRGTTPSAGKGVCYDFQNKGVCQRGRFCHFSHCACNSVCSCTQSSNTYGQRPSHRRNDYDAPPPSPDGSVGSDGSPVEKSTGRKDGYYGESTDPTGEEEEAGELPDTSMLNVETVFAPLENLDRESIAMKRAQLAALGNRRIWANMGLDDKMQKPRVSGLVVSKSGDITYVRPVDK